MFEVDADGNSPFFMPRFREALRKGLAFFRSMEAVLPPNSDIRVFVENLLGRDLMNCIACEGMDRYVRCDRLPRWQERMLKAGFQPQAFHATTIEAVCRAVEEFDERFRTDGGGEGGRAGEGQSVVRLLCEGNPMLAASCWREYAK